MCQIRIIRKKCQKCPENFLDECDPSDCYEVGALALGNWRDCKKCWAKYEAELEAEREKQRLLFLQQAK
ncbi:uncharacterized protein FFNC_08559 [Fusarium fujikuroi]|nr:uncharacterized protein FFNC_08559 [Fusarium fujikuroi]